MSAPPLFDSPLHMMEVQGGSFVKALAHCYRVADSENRAKLCAAFSGYFDRYTERFDILMQARQS